MLIIVNEIAFQEVRLMNKKAQGISINVIIIAAIALLVLVVLSVIFMGRMGNFSGSTKECMLQGGACTAGNCGEDPVADYPTPYGLWECTGEAKGQSCCIKAG